MFVSCVPLRYLLCQLKRKQLGSDRDLDLDWGGKGFGGGDIVPSVNLNVLRDAMHRADPHTTHKRRED